MLDDFKMMTDEERQDKITMLEYSEEQYELDMMAEEDERFKMMKDYLKDEHNIDTSKMSVKKIEEEYRLLRAEDKLKDEV